MASELKFNEEKAGDITKISLSGEVDIYTSQNLKEKLYDVIDSTRSDLYIDCRKLDYIDSMGLGILIGALKKSKQNNNNIYLSGLKENIKKLFLITGLDKLFILEE